MTPDDVIIYVLNATIVILVGVILGLVLWNWIEVVRDARTRRTARHGRLNGPVDDDRGGDAS